MEHKNKDNLSDCASWKELVSTAMDFMVELSRMVASAISLLLFASPGSNSASVMARKL